MTLVAALLGLGTAAGVLLAVACILAPRRPPRPRRAANPQLPMRLLRAVAAAAVILALTRWPVAAAAGAAAAFFGPDLLTGRAKRTADATKSAAIATWCEMLRDTLSSGAGLQQVIMITAPIAPAPIRPALDRLLLRRRAGVSLPESIARLASDLEDPQGDLVVSALELAARGEARDLANLLSQLAEIARENATIRLKADAARGSTRTATRGITAVTIVMAVLLSVGARDYLAPYGTLAGQLVLALVFAEFAAALWWIQRLNRSKPPNRFLRTPSVQGGTP